MRLPSVLDGTARRVVAAAFDRHYAKARRLMPIVPGQYRCVRCGYLTGYPYRSPAGTLCEACHGDSLDLATVVVTSGDGVERMRLVNGVLVVPADADAATHAEARAVAGRWLLPLQVAPPHEPAHGSAHDCTADDHDPMDHLAAHLEGPETP